MPPRQRPARLALKRCFDAPIVIAGRARLLAVCAMLLVPLASGAFAADPQIKPPIRGLVSMGADVLPFLSSFIRRVCSGLS